MENWQEESLGECAEHLTLDHEFLSRTPAQEDYEARSPLTRGRAECRLTAARCSEQVLEAGAGSTTYWLCELNPAKPQWPHLYNEEKIPTNRTTALDEMRHIKAVISTMLGKY